MYRILFTVIAAVVFILAFTLGRIYLSEQHGSQTAGAAAIGGPFTLVDHHGNTVTDKDYRGKYMMVYFGYTYCPDVCPTTLSTISAALDMLPPEQAKKVVVLFISVDPHRDTPKVLADYVPNFSDQIVGLTGTPEQIKAAARAYKAFYAKAEVQGPDDYLMDHSAFVYLMGPDGKYMSLFRHGVQADDMAKQLKQAIK